MHRAEHTPLGLLHVSISCCGLWGWRYVLTQEIVSDIHELFVFVADPIAWATRNGVSVFEQDAPQLPVVDTGQIWDSYAYEE